MYTDNMSARDKKRLPGFGLNRGWKDVQAKRRSTQKTKLALIILAIIFALLVLSQAVKFTQMLFSPWKQTSSVKRTYFWKGDSNINILIKAKGIALLVFSPKDQKITTIDIPQTTYLEVSHGFGKWQLGSVYNLGESQSYGGNKLLTDSLVNLFGLPIDGFLNFSGKHSSRTPNTIVSEIRKNPFFAVNILPFLKTDLTPLELIRLKSGLSSVRFDKIKQKNLENSDLLQEEKLADGTDILIPDTFKLDSMLSSLVDPEIASEHKNIAIFNSTDHPQLAQKAARTITNLGANVIITSNGQNKYKVTYVVGEKSKTLDRLMQIFGSGDIIDPKDGDLILSRAQINVFLGEDYFNRL